MIRRVIKSKHNLWRSTLTAMIREDVHSFGLGAPSIYVEYHRRSAVALVTSLEDPSECRQSVTMHLLTHQVTKLKALATTFLSTREKNVATNKTATQPTYASTSTRLQPRQQAPLSLERKQHHVFRRSQTQKSPPRARKLPPPTLATLINCITKPLMDLGIAGFHDLKSANDALLKTNTSKSTSRPK